VNKGRWSANTIERYSGIVRDFLEPSLGNIPIQRGDRQKVKDLLVDTLAIRSAKSVELTHAVISGIFVEAIDNRIVLENPAQGLLKKILAPKRKRNESAPDPLTRDDLSRVLDAARKHVDVDVAMVIETLAKSGMRLEGCLAMHRDHLDASNCQYMIMETVRHGKFGIPKTGKRLIDLPDDLVARLQNYILRKRKEALSEGKDVTYLFPGITQRLVQKGLERACRTAKLRLRHPHDLRHTYAAILLMDHYSPAYVQKQLGHSSITMTVDTYGHWIPGEGKKDLGKTLGDRMDEHVRRTRRAD
jgi:integrase